MGEKEKDKGKGGGGLEGREREGRKGMKE